MENGLVGLPVLPSLKTKVRVVPEKNAGAAGSASGMERTYEPADE